MTTNAAGVAVITGASGALGSVVARHLVGQRYNVALIGTRDGQGAHGGDEARLGSLVGELGAGAAAFFGDVADAASWGRMLPDVEKKWALPVSHAVLVAGAWRGGAPLHEEKDDGALHAMIRANLDTAHATLRALLPGMVARGQGSVVVIGSRVAERPWSSAGAAAYAASKAGLVALAQAVAAEVLARGVRVNAILPSTLDTPANRRAMPDVDPATWVAPESAAKLVAFLLSDDARDVSGAAIPIYGRA